MKCLGQACANVKPGTGIVRSAQSGHGCLNVRTVCFGIVTADTSCMACQCLEAKGGLQMYSMLLELRCLALPAHLRCATASFALAACIAAWQLICGRDHAEFSCSLLGRSQKANCVPGVCWKFGDEVNTSANSWQASSATYGASRPWPGHILPRHGSLSSRRNSPWLAPLACHQVHPKRKSSQCQGHAEAGQSPCSHLLGWQRLYPQVCRI